MTCEKVVRKGVDMVGQWAALQLKIPLMYSISGNCATSVPISTFMCLWAIYIFLGSVHIFSCSSIGRQILEIFNFSQIYECRNWETEHYNSVLEITASLLGIHKWEPDINIGFSTALPLQCVHCVGILRYCTGSPANSLWPSALTTQYLSACVISHLLKPIPLF